MPIRTNTERIANRPDIASAKPPERKRGIATKERSLGTTLAHSKPASGSPAPAWACRAPLLPFSPTRGRTTVARSHTRPKAREETSGFPSLAAASMAEHAAELLTVGTETRIDQGRQLLVSTRISERAIERAHFRPVAAPRAERLGRVEGGGSLVCTLIGFYWGDEFLRGISLTAHVEWGPFGGLNPVSVVGPSGGLL